jgi:hypothetical protein
MRVERAGFELKSRIWWEGKQQREDEGGEEAVQGEGERDGAGADSFVGEAHLFCAEDHVNLGIVRNTIRGSGDVAYGGSQVAHLA